MKTPLCVWTAVRSHPRALIDAIEQWRKRRVEDISRETDHEDFFRGRKDL
jgi:hypothetical protein